MKAPSWRVSMIQLEATKVMVSSAMVLSSATAAARMAMGLRRVLMREMRVARSRKSGLVGLSGARGGDAGEEAGEVG